MGDGVFLVGRHTSVEMNWTDVDWDCDREYDVIRCTIVPVFINGLPVIRNRDWLPTFDVWEYYHTVPEMESCKYHARHGTLSLGTNYDLP